MAVLIPLFWIATAVAFAMGAGWLFRVIVVRLTRGQTARTLCTAPVSAGFGMLFAVNVAAVAVQ